MKLNEVKAIITGAGSGMGRTFALELARAGAAVAAADINDEGLKQTVAEAVDLNGSVYPIVANVADEDSVAALV